MPFTLILAGTLGALSPPASAADPGPRHGDDPGRSVNVQLGPRPFFLIEDTRPGELKRTLQARANGPFRRSEFSIGHRGAALQFPEHTRESYEAAARMGAGILECDVTFTRDKELVCRHSQCDRHTTTNILATPLAGKCSVPFQPAQFDTAGNLVAPASARCCTSDLAFAEFKTLRGKRDGFNPRARTVAECLAGTPGFRTDLHPMLDSEGVTLGRGTCSPARSAPSACSRTGPRPSRSTPAAWV